MIEESFGKFPPHLEERANSIKRRISMGWKLIVALILFQLFAAAGIIYVAIHFLMKWW